MALALVSGCWDISEPLRPNGAACDDTSPEAARDCEGQICLVLNANVQGIPALCSSSCNVDDECTAHERCVLIDNENFCLRACDVDADCYDGTVCLLFAPGNPTRFCLADPL